MIKPGIYKRDPTSWSICLKGPGRGIATNRQTGQQMDLLEFIAWIYDISPEQAILEVLYLKNGIIEGKAQNN